MPGVGAGGGGPHTLAELLGRDSVSTSEQERGSEPFQSTLPVVQIGQLWPGERECVFE